jgi:hypothetical protein
VGINIAKALSHSIETYEGEIGSAFKTTENDVNELRQILKAVKRRLPHQQQPGDHRFGAFSSVCDMSLVNNEEFLMRLFRDSGVSLQISKFFPLKFTSFK